MHEHSAGFACNFDFGEAQCSGAGEGIGDGQLTTPLSVFADSSTGQVWVADPGSHSIQRFSSAGVFQRRYGTFGESDGLFQVPLGIAVHQDYGGRVLVADSQNNRVQIFDSTGGFIGWMGKCTGGNAAFCDIGNGRSTGFQCTEGLCLGHGPGAANGQFDEPVDVDVALTGSDIYVSDRGSNRIQHFDALGVFIGAWGTAGSGDGQFGDGPAGVASRIEDSELFVYVADPGNDRVQKFTATGTFVGWLGKCTSGAKCDTSVDPDSSLARAHSKGFTCTASTCNGPGAGSGDGQLNGPMDIAMNLQDQSIFVADTGNNRVQRFRDEDTDGVLFAGWAGKCTGGTLCDASAQRDLDFRRRQGLCSGLGAGDPDGQFDAPVGVGLYVAQAQEIALFVADRDNHRVQKYDVVSPATGRYAGWFGGCDGGDGCAADLHRAVDLCNNDGAAQTCDSTLAGSGRGQFIQPASVAIDTINELVYVSDSGNARYQAFTGNFDYDGDAVHDRIDNCMFVANATRQTQTKTTSVMPANPRPSRSHPR